MRTRSVKLDSAPTQQMHALAAELRSGGEEVANLHELSHQSRARPLQDFPRRTDLENPALIDDARAIGY